MKADLEDFADIIGAARIQKDLVVDDTVTISQSQYAELRKDQQMLIALESGGVEEWSGYSNAVEDILDKTE